MMVLSSLQKNVVRSLGKKVIEVGAFINGKSFYCAALKGDSNYNICVNSDMTVSCNCQDYDGSGIIGDLKKGGLKEIFSGQRAKFFRENLASGRLPILTCSRCSDLRLIENNKADKMKSDYKVPRRGIMVENTVSCNLNCLACDRNAVQKIRKKISLNLDDVEKISVEIFKNKIESVSFFNLGEPFLSNNILKELEILKGKNPNLFICLSTNGVLVDTEVKRKAIKYIDLIEFSIDGTNNKMLRKYQKRGNFDLAYKNMTSLVEYRNRLDLKKTIIEWKYVLFNWNDKKEDVDVVVELAKKAKVDRLFFYPSTNPFWGISWRYFWNNYIQSLGIKKDGGIMVNFSRK